MADAPDHAEIRVIPPVIFAAFLAAGLEAAHFLPGHLLPRAAATACGGALILASALVVQSALRAMRRARTTVHPHGRATALVRDGAFRVSRNPLYLGLLLLFAGLSFLANSPWMLALAAPLLAALRLIAIGPEERYLEARFGPAYRAYRAEVRRWL